MIAASDANLAATTDKTIIIPGHGPPVSNRSELKDFRDMLVAIRENVATLEAGKVAGRADGSEPIWAAKAPLLPQESVTAMRRLINTLGPKHSGKFYNYDSRKYPW